MSKVESAITVVHKTSREIFYAMQITIDTTSEDIAKHTNNSASLIFRLISPGMWILVKPDAPGIVTLSNQAFVKYFVPFNSLRQYSIFEFKTIPRPNDRPLVTTKFITQIPYFVTSSVDYTKIITSLKLNMDKDYLIVRDDGKPNLIPCMDWKENGDIT